MATRIKARSGRLYESDFLSWTEEEAALRAGRHDALDLENLAEEIESLGRRDRRELRSRLGVLVTHLLKCRQQQQHRTGSWEATIRTQRLEIEQLLQDSPSLGRQLPRLMRDGYEAARRNAAAETGLPLDDFPPICPFEPDQVLADEWLP